MYEYFVSVIKQKNITEVDVVIVGMLGLDFVASITFMSKDTRMTLKIVPAGLTRLIIVLPLIFKKCGD